MSVATILALAWAGWQTVYSDEMEKEQALHMERHYGEAPAGMSQIETPSGLLLVQTYHSDSCVALTFNHNGHSDTHFVIH